MSQAQSASTKTANGKKAHPGTAQVASTPEAQVGKQEAPAQPAPAPVESSASSKSPDPELLNHVKKQMDTILGMAPNAEAREELRLAMSMAVGPAAPAQGFSTVKELPMDPIISVAGEPQAQAQAPAQAKSPHKQPVQAPLAFDLSKLGVKRKYAAKLPAGYAPESPGLLYTPAGNMDLATGKPRTLEGLVVELAQWGSHAVLVMLPATDVRVILPDGSVFENVETEQVSRAPIVIPVDGDTSNIARDIMEDQDHGIVICMVPSFEQSLADGTLLTRHLVGRGEVIPKKGIWPPE